MTEAKVQTREKTKIAGAEKNLAKVFINKSGSETLLLEGLALIKLVNDISGNLYTVTSGDFYFDCTKIYERGGVIHTQFGRGSDEIEINKEYTSIESLFKLAERIQLTN